MSYDIPNNEILNKMLKWIVKSLLLQNIVELEAFSTYYFMFFEASKRLFEPKIWNTPTITLMIQNTRSLFFLLVNIKIHNVYLNKEMNIEYAKCLE